MKRVEKLNRWSRSALWHKLLYFDDVSIATIKNAILTFCLFEKKHVCFLMCDQLPSQLEICPSSPSPIVLQILYTSSLNLILFISTGKPGCSLHSPIDRFSLTEGRLAVNFQHLKSIIISLIGY